ncbi:MAG TPA: polysaccharide biosynthesis tyrosine autokinase [Actinomycetales bacterium]|nr:polysaccharide biosynthesis tyrosine autokinase [Actinomycetales bacterium]
MELRDYIGVLRKRWLLVTLLTVLCLAGAAAATFAMTPKYQADTQLFVSTQAGDDASQLLQGSSFSQQRVKSYADIVTSPKVLQPVVENLGLTTNARELAKQVSAEAPLDTVLINVSVRDVSPTRAQQIANAVSKQFIDVVQELEKPQGNGTTPVKVSIVQPAELPQAPVTPNKKLNLALGLLVGLALGVGIAVLRETLDTSVKGESDIKDVTDAPVLGGIAYDSEAGKRPLIVQNDPHSPRAEAFRQLRTNLQFVDAANHPRSIVITSSVPGEGKSTSTANLAITLAAAGSSVVLIEGDLRRPRVAEYMGLEGAVGLTNVLIGQASLDDVLQPWGNGRLQVLACGPVPPNPSELLGSQPMNDALRELERRFDYVIIDCPPLLPVTDAAVVSRLAGGTVVVVGSAKINREQLRRAMETLAAVDANVLGVVMNMLPVKGPDSYSYYAYGYGPDRPAVGKQHSTGKRRRPEPDSRSSRRRAARSMPS